MKEKKNIEKLSRWQLAYRCIANGHVDRDAVKQYQPGIKVWGAIDALLRGITEQRKKEALKQYLTSRA
jgi:hypothetical protein